MLLLLSDMFISMLKLLQSIMNISIKAQIIKLINYFMQSALTKTKKSSTNRQELTKRQYSTKPFARLKSSNEVNDSQPTILKRVRPSTGRRPASSKPTDTMNSITTSTSGKSQTEVRSLIETIFTKSKGIKQWIKEHKPQENSADLLNGLLSNQLFTLSLMGTLKNSEDAHSHVEKSIKRRLERNLTLEEQKQKCSFQEGKINTLIEKRLKELNKFS